MALLRAAGLTMDFGGLRALCRVDLEVEEGEIRGLIGPNGSAKTTMLNVVTGVYRPVEGSVALAGQELLTYA